jgi:ABC-type multidrug transport system ATPase subunit
MTEYNLGPHTFHLGTGECVLLSGRSGCKELLKELSRHPDCVLVSLRRPVLFKMNSRVEGALTLLGLKPGCRWKELDTVGRIKLCIAAALNRKVEVLILDNPTRDLNPEERQLLFGALKDLARKTGMAILFTSHDLTDALAIAHRVLAFTMGGRLLESTPDTREDTLKAAFPLLQI